MEYLDAVRLYRVLAMKNEAEYKGQLMMALQSAADFYEATDRALQGQLLRAEATDLRNTSVSQKK
ncbi:MAG: hypothetical protein NVS9B15_13200 [Acidobacteriaceae bacterium]